MDVHMVDGVVLLDGAPFTGATIIFTSLDDGLQSFAMTDKEGYYQLSTWGAKPGTGALMGTYAVTFNKMLSHPQNEDLWIQHCPAKYLDPATSGFEVEVKKGRNRFDFELTSGGEPRRSSR
jgi:hypothetical protein